VRLERARPASNGAGVDQDRTQLFRGTSIGKRGGGVLTHAAIQHRPQLRVAAHRRHEQRLALLSSSRRQTAMSCCGIAVDPNLLSLISTHASRAAFVNTQL
jgi:hypothetical protein